MWVPGDECRIDLDSQLIYLILSLYPVDQYNLHKVLSAEERYGFRELLDASAYLGASKLKFAIQVSCLVFA